MTMRVLMWTLTVQTDVLISIMWDFFRIEVVRWGFWAWREFARTALRDGELLLGMDVAHGGRMSRWWWSWVFGRRQCLVCLRVLNFVVAGKLEVCLPSRCESRQHPLRDAESRGTDCASSEGGAAWTCDSLLLALLYDFPLRIQISPLSRMLDESYLAYICCSRRTQDSNLSTLPKHTQRTTTKRPRHEQEGSDPGCVGR